MVKDIRCKEVKYSKDGYCLTVDGQKIDPDRVWEINKEGYVVSSFRMVILEF